MRHGLFSTRWNGARLAALSMLAVLALLAWGCSEPVTTYQVAGSKLGGGERVLVLPFQDTRTLIEDNDPHKEDVGVHARDIFIAAMKEFPNAEKVTILTPDERPASGSLTIAQLADAGRKHQADVVIAGQVFSYTGTRAASIPPRAGMFIRAVSVKDGSLLFVGDDYLAAAIPGASGGREQQAKNVSKRLLESLVEQVQPVAFLRAISSSAALAMPAPGLRAVIANLDGKGEDIVNLDTVPTPEPPPFIDLEIAPPLSQIDWDKQAAPEAPPLFDISDDFYSLPPPKPVAIDQPAKAEKAEMAAAPAAESDVDTLLNQPLPLLPDLDTVDVAENTEPVETSETPLTPDTLAMQTDEPELAAAPAPVATAEVLTPELAPGEGEWDSGEADNLADASVAVPAENLPSGDDLAADLFANEESVLVEAKIARGLQQPAQPDQVAEVMAAPAAANAGPSVVRMMPVQPTQGDQVETEVEVATRIEPPPVRPQQVVILTHMTQAEYLDQAYDKYGIAKAELDPEPLDGETLSSIAEPALPVRVEPVEVELAALPALDMKTVSEVMASGRPLAAEQPRPTKLVATVDLPDDPEAVNPGDAAESVAPFKTTSAPGAAKVLILPYHERENPNNLIQNTGGGEVVTSLYGSQLALDPAIRVLWDSTASVRHDRLVSREEALRLGKLAGADYVVRGQVVEFRRAQSVPSFYSAVISTAVLAAQVFFAEMSGVDVATEVYRVKDGVCVMSRRDRSQQKYVVQAEKTVRRMAKGMAADVALAITSPDAEAMDPLIDELSPVTVLTNPK